MSDNYLSDPRANTWEGWKAALDIFAKHHKPINAEHPHTVYFAAEHDVLFLSDTPTPLTAERGSDGDMVCTWAESDAADAAMLEALGFHWTDEADCWAKFT